MRKLDTINASELEVTDFISFVTQFDDDGESVIIHEVMTVDEKTDNGDVINVKGESFNTGEPVEYNLDPYLDIIVLGE